MRIILLLTFTLIFWSPVYSQSPALNSQLANGGIYKIGITESGVYVISGKQLEEAGIYISNINPASIQLFVGNPGSLPEMILSSRIDDVIETPIKIDGDGDGKLDASDKIWFYADGPHQWSHEQGEYSYKKNVYADTNYVFLKIDGINGKRITSLPQPNTSSYTSDAYDQLQRYESDITNLLGSYVSTQGSGQQWYGDYFPSSTPIDFTSKFDFRGINANSPAKVSYLMASRSGQPTTSELRIGDQSLNGHYTFTYIDKIDARYAQKNVVEKDIIISADPSVSITYNRSSSKDQAWLDYIQIINRRNVDVYDEQTIIQDHKSIAHENAAFSSTISNNALVWNITTPDNIQQINHTNGSWKYRTNSTLQRFIAFTGAKTPTLIGKIDNQNIHALDDIDMIIIHPAQFRNEAQRLAGHRMSMSNLKVELVNVQHIYNEFSSGKIDPTAIRDFAKMLYDRNKRFKYVLLFGDGTYDYRNRVPDLANHNFIPVYETERSLDPILSFPSDDYYALLSDNEGRNLVGDLEISVGRLPVSSIKQAKVAVDKIVQYDTNENRFGDWRIRIGFAADDEDGNTHFNQSDEIARYIENTRPEYNQQKIYFDAYPQISTPGGDRYTDASDAINRNVQSGQLVLNYLGHGGPNGWAQERVLKKADIDTWQNKDQLPLLITATCTFAGYDNPAVVSAGEYAFRKKDGGCIALYTTVRAVYSHKNKILTEAILKYFLGTVPDAKNADFTLGMIMKNAKNSIYSPNNLSNIRKFALLGDPSMVIAPPTHKIQTTHINKKPVAQTKNDTINALETVVISGIITDDKNQKIEDFNGQLSVTVYDKVSTLETLGNDKGSYKKAFQVYKNILFKGSASVVDGKFTFDFIIPKDINYTVGNGRISYYAHNEETDAAGYYDDILIGSSSSDITDDDTPPTVNVYINDTFFVSGGVTTSDAVLLVKIADDNGINVSGTSIGHDLTATLDSSKTYVLNDFYTSEVDNFKKGMVWFPLNGLDEGWHTLTVKAWDISNNSASSTIRFKVINDFDKKLINAYAYPNPTDGDVNIVFEHDLVGKDIDLELLMYNNAGQLVLRSLDKLTPSGNRIVYNLSEINSLWSQLPASIYYYKININSKELNTSRTSEFEKLVKVD